MEKNEISESTIKRANYKELTALCKKLEVPFKNQSRESLIKLLMKSADLADNLQPDADKKKPSKMKTDPDSLNANQKVRSLTKKRQTKSDKIRSLTASGKTVLEIAKIMSDTHYSFIHSVAKNYLAIRKK